LKRTGVFGTYTVPAETFGAYTSLDDVPDNFDYEFVLVCTKSFDTRSAAIELSQSPLFKSNPDTCFVLCQNGWGNADIFCEYFPSSQIYSARVITGFRRPVPYHVDVTVHADAIHVGSLFHTEIAVLNALCRAVTEGGIPCEVTDCIEKDLWAKMLYNCALNPLGAIVRAPYGKLAESEYTRSLMDSIIDEIFDVIRKAGLQTHWSDAVDFKEVFYTRLIPPTAEHKSSTLQDLAAGKRTEIDALNGAVIQLARKYHISVPTNQTIYSILKYLESP
jgi:2-dehydropantoate 2-reductase